LPAKGSRFSGPGLARKASYRRSKRAVLPRRKKRLAERLSNDSLLMYCEKCKKEFDLGEQKCPICGADLVKEADNDTTAETVATMTILGIL